MPYSCGQAAARKHTQSNSADSSAHSFTMLIAWSPTLQDLHFNFLLLCFLPGLL